MRRVELLNGPDRGIGDQGHAFTLSLMVMVTLFKVEGEFGVMPSDEFDDVDVEIIQEYDPYRVGSAH